MTGDDYYNHPTMPVRPEGGVFNACLGCGTLYDPETDEERCGCPVGARAASEGELPDDYVRGEDYEMKEMRGPV